MRNIGITWKLALAVAGYSFTVYKGKYTFSVYTGGAYSTPAEKTAPDRKEMTHLMECHIIGVIHVIQIVMAIQNGTNQDVQDIMIMKEVK